MKNRDGVSFCQSGQKLSKFQILQTRYLLVDRGTGEELQDIMSGDKNTLFPELLVWTCDVAHLNRFVEFSLGILHHMLTFSRY